MSKSLLIIADAACDTGFATVTHNIVKNLEDWDISVFGINYGGDPHWLQSRVKLYNPQAYNPNDPYGFERLPALIEYLKPDVTLVINDPAIAAAYIKILQGKTKTIAYMPVDAPHIRNLFAGDLSKYDRLITYTEFGKQELINVGITKPINVIPHGVDTSVFYPIDTLEARKGSNMQDNWFIVNVTDRNSFRKRIDLAMYAFAVWVSATQKPDTVKFYYHGDLRDEGWDIEDLAATFGIHNRLIVSPIHSSARGLPASMVNRIYNASNVGLSTTLGEGWGLTTHERMACKIPMIVPRWSALGEWPNGGVHYTSMSHEPMFGLRGLNTEGRPPSLVSIVESLELLYSNKEYREDIANAGYNIATLDKFNWHNIADKFNTVFMEVLNG